MVSVCTCDYVCAPQWEEEKRQREALEARLADTLSRLHAREDDVSMLTSQLAQAHAEHGERTEAAAQQHEEAAAGLREEIANMTMEWEQRLQDLATLKAKEQKAVIDDMTKQVRVVCVSLIRVCACDCVRCVESVLMCFLAHLRF